MATRRARLEPFMVRGTLFTLRRRCGKPTCHCATESGHESPALAYPERQAVTYTPDVDELRDHLLA